MLRLIPSLWDITCYPLRPRVHYSVRLRGGHLHAAYSSVWDRDQSFWLAKSVLNCLIVPFWGSWGLAFQRVKGQIVAMCSWSPDWPLKGALIAWFDFDHSHKRFYKGHISDHPFLARLRSHLDRIPHVLWVTMTKYSLLPRLSVYPHLIYCKPILAEYGNQLGCKRNSGHVVM